MVISRFKLKGSDRVILKIFKEVKRISEKIEKK